MSLKFKEILYLMFFNQTVRNCCRNGRSGNPSGFQSGNTPTVFEIQKGIVHYSPGLAAMYLFSDTPHIVGSKLSALSLDFRSFLLALTSIVLTELFVLLEIIKQVTPV